jgi:hypothetical protein
MEATEKNEKIARQIINLLAEENTSVHEAEQILTYVSVKISNISNVQPVSEKLFDCKG